MTILLWTVFIWLGSFLMLMILVYCSAFFGRLVEIVKERKV